ncbi:MAG: guanylate kinase [Ruminococcus callidus]
MKKGTLFVISGPSGCGKGTVLKEVLKNPDLYFSVSATTRDPRPGEVDGVNYRFMTNEAFEALIEQDGFLEYAGYCDHYYGSPKQPVEEQLAMGKSVILEIEVEGAMKVRAARPDAVFVFILPPSMTELENRLRGRGTEAEEVVQKRVAQARRELGGTSTIILSSMMICPRRLPMSRRSCAQNPIKPKKIWKKLKRC